MKISANWIRDLIAPSGRKTEELGAATVKFIREQDGPPERELKNALSPLLQESGAARSYLAVVQYNDGSEPHVAICLSGLNASRAIVDDIGRVFKTRFKPDTHLDILFLCEQQQQEIEKVCAPFFIRELEQ